MPRAVGEPHPTQEGQLKVELETPYDDLPEYLSVQYFSRRLGLGRSTVYDLVRRAEIPYVRFGHAIRIPKAALRPTQHDPKRRG